MDSAVADGLLGTVLDGRYRVETVLARGGMSTVYGGIDQRLERPVALKVMAPSFADDPVFVGRFIEEARTVARLSHVNIVAVHDQGEDSGRVYLVMELVRGRTLRQLLLEHGRLGTGLAVSVMEAVLAALATAHRAGLVHRDVKPENVLISDDGQVKVTDFGLSRAVAASGSTQTGVVMGTAAYVAPEQVEARRGGTDARADVYSAGIMFYELLTGVPPYTGDSVVSVAYRHVHEDVPPPSRREPGIPPELDRLVRRATRRDPAARPADAGAFLAELHAIRTDAGLRPTPVPPRAPGSAVVRPGNGRTQHTRTLNEPSPAELPPPPPFVVKGLPKDTQVSAAPAELVYYDERRASRRRGLIALLVVMLLAGAAAGAGWWFGAGRYTHVPSMRGLSRADASAAARAANLSLASTDRQVYDDTVRAGQVAGTDPESGAKVTRGSTVTLLVSKGPAPVDVPDVTGESRTDAEAELSGAGFKVTVTEQFDDADKGTVIDQDPADGTAPKGSTVRITVSKGSELVKVPYVGLTSLSDAREQLEDLGFDVEVKPVLGTDEPESGTVIGQDPSFGTKAQRGSTVTLTVIPT